MAEQAKPPLRQPLIDALEYSDHRHREGRADRILWVSQRDPGYGAVVGRVEWLALLNEARECYVNAHYIAALLVALAFVEHTIADTLLESLSFKQTIKAARERKLFPDDVLERTDRLRCIRNPFAHRRPDSDPDTLGSRYLAQGVHPRTVMEADAQEALELMYAYYRRAIEGAT